MPLRNSANAQDFGRLRRRSAKSRSVPAKATGHLAAPNIVNC
ncbi:hypothetical protein BV133_631 [Blastochloris viridis]|uniref:Uncharacterized protein n=1 Tax=Blastochloris viridis TaxID=1079 RepID=A0A182CYL7_BLAVI|nr:hypothetical protein BV133_631 [Blastochloris viridis]